MDLKPVEHNALQSSNESRKSTYLPSEAPAEHLTIGEMIQARNRVEEEASRRGWNRRKGERQAEKKVCFKTS